MNKSANAWLTRNRHRRILIRPHRFFHIKGLANLAPPRRRHLFFAFFVIVIATYIWIILVVVVFFIYIFIFGEGATD
jgi:hypothetical protein